ncbi:FecR domain-containing protein [uncultured Paraglaciecola sp.]|uniref:FecR family protein n=1 Tax=uncultured Paraglaciecola sp. TaxID=1765024 RepID=UPI0030DD05EC|tara:strand:- start:9202 stop:10176 length:975 start_codon:yes stop_codon:yes gene_type:complete
MVNSSSILFRAAEWARRFDIGEIDESDWQDFEKWLAESDENRQAFEQAQEVWLETSVSDQNLSEVLALSSGSQPTKPFYVVIKEWFTLPKSLTSASIASVLVVILWSYFSLNKASTENEYVFIETTEGESRQVELEDGSLLSIKPSSKLAYRYSTQLRHITLTEGEVFFDVEPNPTRTFEISAGDNTIKVLGTSFDVQYVNGRVNVEVTKGVVSVTPTGAFSSLRLTVGNNVSIENDDRIIPFNNASANRSGAIVFENQTLVNILKDLDRYFPEKLIVSSISGYELYSGIIYLDNLGTVLTQLSLISDIEISFTEQAGVQVKKS